MYTRQFNTRQGSRVTALFPNCHHECVSGAGICPAQGHTPYVTSLRPELGICSFSEEFPGIPVPVMRTDKFRAQVA